MADPNVLVPLPNDGTRGARLEIDEFCLDNEMTNLFLIALSSLQQKSLDPVDGKPNWLNFYAIAGIHGKPGENWNGVGNKPVTGYCHHSLNTFPTWHRPYMFLFELAVYNEMVKQADKFSDGEKDAYKKAAARFRLPYWDLVMPRNEYSDGSRPDTVWGCPRILKAERVTVRLPKPTADAKDGWDTIANPLYSFKFPKNDEYAKYKRAKVEFSSRFNSNETTRIPTANGVTNVDLVDLAIQRQAAARATMMWQMLNPDLTAGDLGGPGSIKSEKINDYRSWEAFANRELGNKVTIQNKSFTSPSVESWHDGIHVLLGTGQWWDSRMGFPGGNVDKENTSKMSGQMGNPDFAAFDPIFFLHHCNIDRLLSIYEALFPDKYCNANDAKIELQPFLDGKSPKSCWKSNDPYIKDYWNAGFAVPGNKEPGTVDKTIIRQTIMQYLSGTYYWATSGVLKKEALPKWPKKLDKVWALQEAPPKNAISSEPRLEVTTLKLDAGIPHLFAREVAIPIKVAASQPQVKDIAIKPNSILDVTHTADSQLPAGAFQDPASVQQPAVQITWNASVKVRKFAFNGSFSVHIFVGWVKDEQPERYMTKKNEAGFTGVFARGGDGIEGCENCVAQRDRDIIVDDVIPLTTILYDYLEAAPGSETLIRDGDIKTIPDLSPDSVVPFLKEQLRWRIIDLSATLLADQEHQAGLEITVSSRPFTPPTAENMMGVYGPETVHIEITNEKPGGFGYVYPTAT